MRLCCYWDMRSGSDGRSGGGGVVANVERHFVVVMSRVAQENRHGFALSSSGLHCKEWLAGKTGRVNLFGCYRCWFALSFAYSFVNLQIRDAIWGDYQKMQHAGEANVTIFELIFGKFLITFYILDVVQWKRWLHVNLPRAYYNIYK